MRWESTTGALSLNLTRARPLPSCTWSSMHTLFGGWMGGWSYERRVERSRGKHKKDISLFKTTNTQNVFVLVITRLFIHKAVSVMTGWITAQNCSLSSIAWVILPRPHAHFCTGQLDSSLILVTFPSSADTLWFRFCGIFIPCLCLYLDSRQTVSKLCFLWVHLKT